MSIVSIVSTSPTIDRIEPIIVKTFKATATASEGSGAFTFCTETISWLKIIELVFSATNHKNGKVC